MKRYCLVGGFLGVGLFGAVSTAPATIIANFAGDYNTPAPAAGWSYLWNSGGAIGNSAHYSPLTYDPTIFNSTLQGYDVTPGTFPAGGDASYTLLIGGFMHPGLGSSEGSQVEHFTIAAYTVSTAGDYSVVNLVTSDGDSGGGDGVDFWVGANNTGSIVGGYNNGGSFSDSSIPLRHLNSGDVIYVATGAKTNNGNDSTNINYQIDFTPEPASVSLIALGGLGLLSRRRHA